METIQLFTSRAAQYHVLSIEEERELTVQYWANKDIATRNKLVNHNLRLVMSITFEYSRSLDLLSEGSIGLIEGIKRFDPTRGTKLSTYVSYWIRAYILSYLVRDARLVKVGTTAAQQKLFFNLRKERAKLEAQGLDVTPEMIAEKLGVETREVEEMEVRLHAEKQLDQPIFDDGSTTLDFVAADGISPDEALEEVQRREALSNFSTSLLPNEKVIFEYRLLQDATLQEVGDRLNLTRERIRQVEMRVKDKLKRYCENRNLHLV